MNLNQTIFIVCNLVYLDFKRMIKHPQKSEPDSAYPTKDGALPPAIAAIKNFECRKKSQKRPRQFYRARKGDVEP